MALAPSLFQEAASLYWPAKLHVAIAAMRFDKKDKAKIVLQEILDGASNIMA